MVVTRRSSRRPGAVRFSTVTAVVGALTLSIFAPSAAAAQDTSDSNFEQRFTDMLKQKIQEHKKLVALALPVIGCAVGSKLGGKNGCIATAVAFSALGVIFYSVPASADVPDVGNRPADGGAFVTVFSGTFQGADTESGTATYQGTRTGSVIRGTYVAAQPGQFSGVINRAGTVNGRYSEAGERGTFRGTADRSLSNVIGNVTCTSGCGH